MGQEAENAFGQLNLTNGERKDYDKVEQGFDSYFQRLKRTHYTKDANLNSVFKLKVSPVKHTSEHCMLWQKDVIMDKIKTRTFVVKLLVTVVFWTKICHVNCKWKKTSHCHWLRQQIK